MTDSLITPIQHVLDAQHRYFFVAIGGIGMSAIAQILRARGFRVAGSDIQDSSLLDHLRQYGIEIHIGHDATHLNPDDIIVLSDAIKADNPEWQQALAWGLQIIKRADLLGAVTNAGQGIAVSGTHGKTTSSGMLALIFLEAKLNPTCLLGGELTPLGGNARIGGELILVEACEAYNSFLSLQPEIALVTNIEVDHLDFHGTATHLYDSFRQFLRQTRSLAVVNGDDPMLQTMCDLAPRTVTFGQEASNDYCVTDIELSSTPSFTLYHDACCLGVFTLQVPGKHNILNAAGAAVVALEMGISVQAVRAALAAFPGMHRRFERLGTRGHATIVDDYAHHPTEIIATITAAREAFPGRIIAVFQPHLFSRTRDLLQEFARALMLADYVILAPIYPAREAPIPGITHQLLVEQIHAIQPTFAAYSVASLEECVQILTQTIENSAGDEQSIPLPRLQSGDVIITIGAGDINSVGYRLFTSTHAHVVVEPEATCSTSTAVKDN